MEQHRFERMRLLFREAASLPPGAWRRYLAEHAADDASLAREVLEMLELRTDGEKATVPGTQPVSGVGATPGHPSHIGQYRIVRVLGEGGMGTVYEAIESTEIERSVALKLIKLGMQSEEVVQRFERERQALAMMNHVGIAKVHTCGVSDVGQPYFVMELVHGVPLADFCERKRLSLRKRLRLVRQLCAAVHHAHQKGVVHRDLKPGNVLVTDQDGVLQLKVIDFGLAKSIGGALPRGEFKSQSFVAGTVSYMAPEQAISTSDVDTRADIYSIGVILYELLVGELPLSYDELMRDGPAGFAAVLRQVEPPRPSARLDAAGPTEGAAIAASRRLGLEALRKQLRRDLDWITLTALEKDRERRYASAAELAADIQRFLEDEPVLVGPPTARYRLAKFVRRNRGKLLAIALLMISVLTGAALVTSTALERDRALREFLRLDGVVSMERIRDGERKAGEEMLGNEAVLASWIDDAEGLASRREEFVASRDLLAAQSGSGTVAGDQPAFARDAEGYLHRQLTALVAAVDDLRAKDIPAARARQRWLQQVREATFAPCEGRPTWADVRQSLARRDSPYARADVRFEDDDVVGLVPIGVNERTGLWELYHLRSAWNGSDAATAIPLPRHDEDGRIEVLEGTGIVFVLLPGGRTTLGTGSPLEDELQLHTVELRPFLLARHEITRGQWRRLGGADTHWHRSDRDLEQADVLGDRHPAENIDWHQTTRLLQRHGLQLPTESQWEYGCRAGTTTPWWTGRHSSSTAMQENLVDPRAAQILTWRPDPEGHDDPVQRLARVGAMGGHGGNAFGLLDVLGNVSEWCRDASSRDDVKPRPGDGLRVLPQKHLEDESVVIRGGSFILPPSRARATSRLHVAPDFNAQDVGARAARPLRRSNY
jgi:serine/threonine protein kinase/formylglycine-generating enzyme required for sulfatase activity